MRNGSVKIIVLVLVAIAAAILAARPATACSAPDRNFTVGLDPNGVITSVTVSARTFPAADPNQNTCACGLSLPAGATTSGVQVLDLDQNPIPQFLGFSSNPDTTNELQSLRSAASGTSWSGFNSALNPNNIPVGQALLRFAVSAPGMTGPDLKLELLRNGLVGAAQADLNGENFDPAHTAIVELGAEIPTLSGWGMAALMAVILLGGIMMVMRRRRQAQVV